MVTAMEFFFHVALIVKLPSPTPTTLTDTSASVLSSVQLDLANRRTKQGISRQDSRLSVKSLIESIENATKQAKAGNIFVALTMGFYVCICMCMYFSMCLCDN